VSLLSRFVFVDFKMRGLSAHLILLAAINSMALIKETVREKKTI
jgi:hypothetical protein